MVTTVKFSPGDRVRIDIPNRADPDFDDLHGEHGTITAVLTDDADDVTGIEADARLYRVELDNGSVRDVRGREVRDPISQK